MTFAISARYGPSRWTMCITSTFGRHAFNSLSSEALRWYGRSLKSSLRCAAILAFRKRWQPVVAIRPYIACEFGYTLDETDGTSCIISDTDATLTPTRAPTPSVPVNLAVSGLATQSSTCFGADASRSIDDDVSSSWTRDSISHTCSEKGAWWQVELIEPAIVDYVEVFNRMDRCCQHYLGGHGGAQVQLLDYENEGSALVVVASAELGVSEGVDRFHFPFEQTRASAVRILKRQDQRGTLPIVEVVVMGQGGNLPASTPLQNLAAAKTNTAEQSRCVLID